jgi:hypothetical protein
LHNGLRVDARFAPGPWFFARQGVEAACQKALVPAGDFAAMTTQFVRDRLVLPAVTASTTMRARST